MCQFVKKISNVLKNIFLPNYKNIGFPEVISIYFAPMWNKYNPIFDLIIFDFLKNFDHITKVEKSSSFCPADILFTFDNGKKVRFAVVDGLHHFLEHIDLYDPSGQHIRSFSLGRPSRKMMLMFLDYCSNWIYIDGEHNYIRWCAKKQTPDIEFVSDFFSFNQKENNTDM